MRACYLLSSRCGLSMFAQSEASTSGPRARQPAHLCERQGAERTPIGVVLSTRFKACRPGSADLATTIGWAQLHVRVTLRVWR
jgi:hypothetical protein